MGLCLSSAAAAQGVTAYLPIDLSPFQSRQLEMLFVLADQPLLRRPVPVALVEDAMTRGCPRDPGLCASMQRWLQRYQQSATVTEIAAETALSDHTSVVLPNRRGERTDDHWQLSAAAQWQPSPYLLLGVGAIAREGETLLTGTALSVGNAYAQLDVGFRDRWLSPLENSSFLIGTQAATMPSVSISNSRPISRMRLSYEVNLSRMSESDRIVDNGAYTSGHPLLAGMHVGIEPARGWALGFTRQMQFGGGTRDASLSSLFKAFFRPNHYDN
ncbi:MAG TPA: capsule assembly Wzi family protein, partial [Steroidobacteraceae bacterium]|nr:capsule assembly Wzi family protein [Steroidobacteraceae bacterium]